jgi:hypothetical protein
MMKRLVLMILLAGCTGGSVALAETAGDTFPRVKAKHLIRKSLSFPMICAGRD